MLEKWSSWWNDWISLPVPIIHGPKRLKSSAASSMNTLEDWLLSSKPTSVRQGRSRRAVSHLMAMEAFKSYFEFIMYCGCGIPRITLTGTCDDWQMLRQRRQRFADYGLDDWIEALDPILAQFELAKSGKPDCEFWRSMFRYNSGSGPAVMTGWANVLFPYLKDADDKLYKNPYLADWQQRLAIDERQHGRERWDDPQGVGFGAVPSCFTSAPLTVFWGSKKTPMRLVGGLMGVTQDEQSLAVQPECGWAVIYEEPIDALSSRDQWFEKRKRSPMN